MFVNFVFLLVFRRSNHPSSDLSSPLKYFSSFVALLNSHSFRSNILLGSKVNYFTSRGCSENRSLDASGRNSSRINLRNSRQWRNLRLSGQKHLPSILYSWLSKEFFFVRISSFNWIFRKPIATFVEKFFHEKLYNERANVCHYSFVNIIDPVRSSFGQCECFIAVAVLKNNSNVEQKKKNK